MKLSFRPVTLEDYDLVQSYTAPYGEGSCQHGFVAMYSTYEKYGDQICIQDGFLFVLRSHLCEGTQRVYLAPMGGGDLKAAYETILEDAHAYGAKAKFCTLTRKHADFLRENFPKCFDFEESRDLSEYIYTSETFAYYPGSKLRRRRDEVRQFWEEYGTRAAVKAIEQEDLPDIRDFEKKWLQQNQIDHDLHALSVEARLIFKQLEHFDTLHLSGVIVRVDGQVAGFSYGTPLNEEYYDTLIEKADTSYLKCYQVVRQESVKQCAMEYRYISLEEDVGVEGLRTLKTLYRPVFMIDKLIVTEK